MVKIFGERVLDKKYVVRPGVYGIATDPVLGVALVEVPFGYHLPGGGIESGEDHHSCLKREFLEETGCAIEIEHLYEISRQYAYSERSQNYYELVGHFYKVIIMKQCTTPTELDHKLVWFKPEEAVKRLSLEYQAEAVRNALLNIEESDHGYFNKKR